MSTFGLVLLVAAILAALAGSHLAYFRVKSRHPEMWRRLGSPSLWSWTTRGSRTQRRLGSFLFRGEFMAAGDAALTVYCVTWIAGIVLLVGQVVFIAIKALA